MRIVFTCIATLFFMFSSSRLWAQAEPVYVNILQDTAIKAGNILAVQDTVFFDPQLKPTILRTNQVNNIISLRINEYLNRMLPDSFQVTVSFKVSYLNKDNVAGTVSSKSLTINYNKGKTYSNRAVYTFQGAHRVAIEVLQVTASFVSASAVLPFLQFENRMIVDRDYAMNCIDDAIAVIAKDTSAISQSGELKVFWTPNKVSENYDLEWTYIDQSALAEGRYTVSGQLDQGLIFANNATRVTVAGNKASYMIPLLYDNNGTLFYRVRGTKQEPNGEIITTLWSSERAPATGLGQYVYAGHERKLNWQATTTFAEEGKRKSVVQYFDGSLRNRQTVTKDNTTGTTVVAETLYDKQGRPAIQVMPAPTISTLIKYTPSFNVVDVNGREYDKGVYDTLAVSFCADTLVPMNKVNGAAQYYSASNPLVDQSYHQYIPDAKGYAFSQTQYVQDNTGRVFRQGGVGKEFQIGSNHETRYYYGTPDQNELDALFGTEVGDNTHYQKNMVRDANGQYSVSYVDMHGRTIATALAGTPPPGLKQLDSYRDSVQTDNLLNSTSNIVNGTQVQSTKSILVPRADSLRFTYSLATESLTLLDSKQQNICYDCLYDLNITITDDCGNQSFGGQPKVITLKNFKLFQVDTTCQVATPIDTSFTVYLTEGSYNVSKVLSISRYGMDYYRDSLYLPHNGSKTYEDFYREQMAVIKQRLTCSLDEDTRPTYLSYRDQMLMDLTPLVGQYADTLSSRKCYSIFDKVSGVAVYQNISNYKDENGDPDLVMNSAGSMVPPQQLTPDEFIANFKESWLDALLHRHPEYSLLSFYESLKDSHIWDDEFERTDTYADALAKGYLNPTAITTQQPASNFTIVNLQRKVD